MSRCMRSPGRTVMVSIVMPGAGMISHQAEYSGLPPTTSCSVPAWIKVLSVSVQLVSRQPPPMPAHVDEYSSSPFLCWEALGTVQLAVTEWKVDFPGSRAPWLYPHQFVDWLALSTAIGAWRTTPFSA